MLDFLLPIPHCGLEIVTSRDLGTRPPRLERERFSGGINLSAKARNAKRMGDAMKVYRLASEPTKLFCAPWVAEIIREQVPSVGIGGAANG